MVELQLINKILKDKSLDIITDNYITPEYFHQYKEEFRYILQHKEEYGNVPDTETFLDKFPDFDIIKVEESDEFLIKTFREEYLYSKAVPVLTHISELMQTDTNKALEYLRAELPGLNIANNKVGVDIIAEAADRLKEWEETRDNKESHFTPTGFEELDDIIGGFHCGEELIVIFARTGVGKTWVAVKMLEHAWKMKRSVGLVEPEMSANKTGYRFDTLHSHISNMSLTRGDDVQGYSRYINNLKNNDTPFYVARPRDFDRKITVSKLRTWVENNKLDILAIDGITYLQDERKDRWDDTPTQLTHISEDLMDLSMDLKIPVLVVVQGNREGAKADDLSLEHIRGSDGISHNASIVISVQQKEEGLQLLINKSRNSIANKKLLYMWDADLGKFDYIPSDNSKDMKKAEELRRKYSEDSETY